MATTGSHPAPTVPRTAGLSLAALGAAIIGIWNVLTGIAAITEDPVTEQLNEVLYGIDIQVWGVVWLVAGIIQVIVAWFIFQRAPWAEAVGVGWALVNLTLAAFVIFVAPIYALTMVTVNMAVIYALTRDRALPREGR